MVLRMPLQIKPVLSKDRTSDSRLGKRPACLIPIPAPYDDTASPPNPEMPWLQARLLPGPSGGRGGRTLSLARSLTALPRIATCVLPSFLLPSSTRIHLPL